MNVHPQIPARHRTLRPTLPRAGAGAHRERSVVRRLSTAFILLGSTR